MCSSSSYYWFFSFLESFHDAKTNSFGATEHEQIEQNTCFRLTFSFRIHTLRGTNLPFFINEANRLFHHRYFKPIMKFQLPSLPVIAAEVWLVFWQTWKPDYWNLVVKSPPPFQVSKMSPSNPRNSKKNPKTKLGVKITQKTFQKHLPPLKTNIYPLKMMVGSDTFPIEIVHFWRTCSFSRV